MINRLSTSDPQNGGAQYLEDISTSYWSSIVLFTAVELEIFTRLHPDGKSAEDLEDLGIPPGGLKRLLNALCALGLVVRHKDSYYNSKTSSEFLVKGAPLYQGDAVLWRKELLEPWLGFQDALVEGGRVNFLSGEAARKERFGRYSMAMEALVKPRLKDILGLFPGLPAGAEVLDVGSGTGAVAIAFLQKHPELRATLMDMPEVLELATKALLRAGVQARGSLCETNALDDWPFKDKRFDLIVLSNIVHAFSHEELRHLLGETSKCLKDGGYVLIHDYFFEHFPERAALFDLNMFMNTYNGRVFSASEVAAELQGRGFVTAGPIPTSGDTAMLVAARDEATLAELRIDTRSILTAELKALGFKSITPVNTSDVTVSGWVEEKCKFGCEKYGSPNCPPNSPSASETREKLGQFSSALLLEGEPPGRDFQLLVLRAEREAFRMGYYKAFSYWAGPCLICENCHEGACKNTKDARPSMEGAGIDVYETVRKAGHTLRPLKEKDEYVKYFALLLLQ